ncbi:hypothetical protein ABPG72_009670 [Tetrahymena utriculariae]
MSSPQLEQQQQSQPVLESPDLQQQVSKTQMITENAISEDRQLKEKPYPTGLAQSEAITRYASEAEIKYEEAPKGTILGATAQILKSGIGTGILFLPSTFQACGIALSITFMVACSIVCYFCWILITKIIRFQESTDTKDPTNRNLTLEACGGKLYGKSFEIFLQVCTYFYSYFTCFGYAIFIYQSLESTFPNHMITMAIMLALYLPLSMYKRIDKLSFFTYIALAATVVTLFVIIGKSAYVINTTDVQYSKLTQWDFSQLPLQFGVFSFAYDVNGVYTEVHASMKTKKQFDYVLLYYLVIFTSLGIFVGFIGYVAFGADTQAVIFDNIGSMKGVGTALAFLYSLAELASILLYIFCVVKFFDRMINRYIIKDTTKYMSLFQEFTTRAVIFFSFTFLALYVTQINVIFNIIGCVFCTILTYGCPIFLYFKARKVQDRILKSVQNGDVEKATEQAKPSIEFLSTNIWIYILCVGCLIFGLLGGISGLVSSVIQLQQTGLS